MLASVGMRLGFGATLLIQVVVGVQSLPLSLRLPKIRLLWSGAHHAGNSILTTYTTPVGRHRDAAQACVTFYTLTHKTDKRIGKAARSEP
jgi:hypothetical protein